MIPSKFCCKSLFLSLTSFNFKFLSKEPVIVFLILRNRSATQLFAAFGKAHFKILWKNICTNNFVFAFFTYLFVISSGLGKITSYWSPAPRFGLMV